MGQMGPHWAAACPFLGVSCFRKKGFGVFGGCIGARHVPFWGFLVSGKKVLAFLGGASAVHAKTCMSLFGGFLFGKKTQLGSTTFFQLSGFDMWPHQCARFFIVVRCLSHFCLRVVLPPPPPPPCVARIGATMMT